MSTKQRWLLALQRRLVARSDRAYFAQDDGAYLWGSIALGLGGRKEPFPFFDGHQRPGGYLNVLHHVVGTAHAD